MSPSYSPEKFFSYEQSNEQPTLPAGLEESEHHALKPSELNEDAILDDMRLRNKERYKLLERVERQLVRSFADNPGTLYKEDRLVVKEQEVPFWRLLDLEESLRDLSKFKDQLPKRYKANVDKVVEKAEFVKKILENYRSWAETEARWDPLTIKEGQIDLLVKLRRIAPDRFPRDLAELTDKEFELLALPQIRLEWDGLLREAQLAEYDPDRFRRLFGDKYPPERMAKEEAHWAAIDEDNRNMSNVPNCLQTWKTIESALQKSETNEV